MEMAIFLSFPSSPSFYADSEKEEEEKVSFFLFLKLFFSNRILHAFQ